MSWRFKLTFLFYPKKERQNNKENEEKRKGKKRKRSRSRNRTRKKKKTVEIINCSQLNWRNKSTELHKLLNCDFYWRYLRIIRQNRILCHCFFGLALNSSLFLSWPIQIWTCGWCEQWMICCVHTSEDERKAGTFFTIH